MLQVASPDGIRSICNNGVTVLPDMVLLCYLFFLLGRSGLSRTFLSKPMVPVLCGFFFKFLHNVSPMNKIKNNPSKFAATQRNTTGWS